MDSGRTLRVGLLGAGTVGSSLLRLVEGRGDVEVRKALVRDLGKPRAVANPERILTTDPDDALEGVDAIVEVLGGTGTAGDLILRALDRGLPVVTANKAVLATRWDELREPLREGRLHFEAAVLAGTPAIGPLTGALAGSRPRELHAILNGTCTYILGELEAGRDFQVALREAQRLGYAEADPSLDVDGIDAAHKLAVLARLVFDPEMPFEHVLDGTTGIAHLTPAIVREAMEDGGRVRLVGSILRGDGGWLARVRPVYLPAGHPLAADAAGRGGLLFRGDPVGDVFIAGPGAGGMETASAVLADILAVRRGDPGPRPRPWPAPLPDEPPERLDELLRA